MRRFWSWLAVWCGKHAGLVGVIGLLLTLTLAAGTTQLKFQTSQASYLNRSDQIYKDDVRYEQLFGGQAMVVMFTMDGDATVDQFFTPQQRDQARRPGGPAPRRGRRSTRSWACIGPDHGPRPSARTWSPSRSSTARCVPAPDITKSIAGAALLRGHLGRSDGGGQGGPGPATPSPPSTARRR